MDQPKGPVPIFKSNKIEFANEYGLYTYNASDDFKPRDNYFAASNGNKYFAAVYANNRDGSQLDAEANYWDDNKGPASVDNPGGLEAPAGALVDFDPWIGKDKDEGDDPWNGTAPEFGNSWEADLYNGGFFLRSNRHSENIKEFHYHRIATEDPGLEEEEKLLVCESRDHYPGVKVSEDFAYEIVCDGGEKVWSDNFHTTSAGKKTWFTRAAYRVKEIELDEETSSLILEYRIIDKGWFVPYWLGGSTPDAETRTLTAAGSPYFLAGGSVSDVNIEPGAVILVPSEIYLHDEAKINAKGATFISVRIPDLDQNGNISWLDRELYVESLDSLADIEPKGDYVQFYLNDNSALSLEDCLIINEEGSGGIYHESSETTNCDQGSLTIKNSKLYNFDLDAVDEAVEISGNTFENPDNWSMRLGVEYGHDCPIVFRNNTINFSKIKSQDVEVNEYSAGAVNIYGGTGKVVVDGNVMKQGYKLGLHSWSNPQNPSKERILVENNELYHSRRGIVIETETTSESPEPEEFFNINRLKVVNNRVSINPDDSEYESRAGLTIKDFRAENGDLDLLTEDNKFGGLVNFNGYMAAGELTLTSELLENLCGKKRTLVVDPDASLPPYHYHFQINKDATFRLLGTQEKPITLISRQPSGHYLDINGTFEAENVLFVPKKDYQDWPLHHSNGLRFFKGSSGKLSNVHMRRLKPAITVYTDDLQVNDSIFVDNANAIAVYNVAPSLVNNHFARNQVGIDLLPEEDSSGAFSDQPFMTGNIFENNNVAIQADSLSGNLSLDEDTIFIGGATGIWVASGSGSISATDIFWGDNSGPSATENENGAGVDIIAPPEVVEYDPWKTITEEYTVTPSIGRGLGSITPAAEQKVKPGETVQFSLTPDPGYHVEGISGGCGGTFDEENNTFSTQAVTHNCTVTADFALDSHELTVHHLGHGTVFGNGISTPVDNTQEFIHGTETVLLAKGKEGYGFDSWKNCDDPAGIECTMTMDSDKECTAVFKKGDSNEDGILNLPDFIIALQILTGQAPDSDAQNYLHLDVNRDQKIGLEEAISILQILGERELGK